MSNSGSATSQQNFNWGTWKTIQSSKNFVYQYTNDSISYTIWGYDGPDTYTTTIWKNIVPDGVINGGYSQAQNDSDKSDFETNYLPNANKSINKLAATGVDAKAPAKGLGGFAPDPMNNPYQPVPDEVVSLYVDGEGQLISRSTNITDEGSLRDDFTGTSLEINLTGTLTFTNGSNIVSGSGTIFTQELNRDDYVKLVSDGYIYWDRVERVPNDTTLVLVNNYNGSSSSGQGEKTRWLTLPQGSVSGTISVGSSVVTLSSGTVDDGSITIYRDGDYLPLITIWSISVSQRIDGQTLFLGFRDDITNPTMYCDVIINGTDNTSIIFRSAWNSDEESSTITIPSGLDTSQNLRYKIDVSPDYCSLLINGVLVSRHENHIPDPYSELLLCAGINNFSTVSNTDMVIDTIFFSNQDQLQISSIFSSPLAIVNREDQHTLTGSLTTSSTSSDQIILSYTVPNNKVLYIVGYRVQVSGSASGNPIKIGRNDISSSPSSPGSIDSNVFRFFALMTNGDTGEVNFSTPRKLGVGGDVVKLSTTPSSSSSTIWYAAIDFVLR